MELQNRACDKNDFKYLSACLEDLKTGICCVACVLCVYVHVCAYTHVHTQDSLKSGVFLRQTRSGAPQSGTRTASELQESTCPAPPSVRLWMCTVMLVFCLNACVVSKLTSEPRFSCSFAYQVTFLAPVCSFHGCIISVSLSKIDNMGLERCLRG